VTYFDYESIAREAGIEAHILASLRQRLRDEFPHDDMMFELHMVRACMGIRDGMISLADILAPPSATPR
jgi:hypothetical protein